MGVLVKLIRELNDALDLTSIVVSHDVQETAAIADYVYLLSEGRVVDHGKPKDLWRLSVAMVAAVPEWPAGWAGGLSLSGPRFQG